MAFVQCSHVGSVLAPRKSFSLSVVLPACSCRVWNMPVMFRSTAACRTEFPLGPRCLNALFASRRCTILVQVSSR